ncbi:hypothetical protein NDU88_002471 [Pleurodeles waltl]|uniref:Uncharacterized protein n=1 Tax=Pleurodeles waltl TaxID=8319 RepID=A0AAV7P9S3_PLEWA|nr:hypothetical protein NDU88_002471 [Pleurodeles waltl]
MEGQPPLTRSNTAHHHGAIEHAKLSPPAALHSLSPGRGQSVFKRGRMAQRSPPLLFRSSRGPHPGPSAFLRSGGPEPRDAALRTIPRPVQLPPRPRLCHRILVLRPAGPLLVSAAGPKSSRRDLTLLRGGRRLGPRQ